MADQLSIYIYIYISILVGFLLFIFLVVATWLFIPLSFYSLEHLKIGYDSDELQATPQEPQEKEQDAAPLTAPPGALALRTAGYFVTHT